MNLSGRSLAWIGLATTLLALFIAGVSIFSFPADVFAQEAPPQVQQDYANAPQTNNGPSGPIEWVASGIGDVLLGAVAGIAFVFLFIAAQLLGLAAAAFDIAVKFLVLDFGFFFGNSAGLLVGWSILRDIGNILLLFGFVSIGVQTILNINHFNVGKTLPRLILFAILLNFSLFITEAIIDTSNGIASGIYTQAYGADTSVSAEILAQTGIVTLLNADKVIEGLIGGDQMFRTFAFLMLAVFLSVAAFALFTGAILLVTRAVVLAFLMLTSPIGFAGMAIPQLNKIADEWWNALINNALFAPVYLILIMVSLKVAQTLPLVIGGSSSPDLLNAVASTKAADIGGAIIMFLLMIGFLILSIMSAKQFSMAGASFATKTAGALTYGVPGWLGRRTLGAASNRAARAIRSTGWGANTLAGRNLARLADVGAKASFDVRSATPFKATAKAAKVDMGEPNKVAKGGRREELNDIRKRASEDAETFEKARKTTDGIKKDGIDRLQREENVQRELGERANKNAEDARKAGSPERAKFFESQRDQYFKAADKIKESREKGSKKIETSQVNRLTDEQKILYEYAKRGGSGEKEREKTGALAEREAEFAERAKEAAEHTANVNKYLSEAENAAKKLADIEKKRAEAAADRRAGIAGADKRFNDLETERQVAEAAKADADKTYRNAKEEGDKAERARKEAETKKVQAEKALEEVKAARKKMAGGADEYLKPSYALQQIAQSLDRLSRMPLGSDFAEAARGIRNNAGQSKEAKLAHEIQHMLEHASHGDDHGGKDHKEEKHDDGNKGGGAGGGGGHGPAAH